MYDAAVPGCYIARAVADRQLAMYEESSRGSPLVSPDSHHCHIHRPLAASISAARTALFTDIGASSASDAVGIPSLLAKVSLRVTHLSSARHQVHLPDLPTHLLK